MKLHSIDIPNKNAIIEHEGRLIDVEFYFDGAGIAYITDIGWTSLKIKGVENPVKAVNLIRSHLASAPKASTEQLEQAVREAVGEIYSAYNIDVSDLSSMDIYELHNRYKIEDHSGCIQHASKKLLLSGKRTGGKSKYDDIKEARDTLNRWLDINNHLQN